MNKSRVDLAKAGAYKVLNGWSECEMARKMGMNSASLNRIFRGERNAGGKFIAGLLRIGMKPSDIFLPEPLLKSNGKESGGKT